MLDAVASLKNIASLRSMSNFEFIKGDIRCTQDLQQVLHNHNIDCVLHFAASSHVQESFDNTVKFAHNNATGTLNLLDAVRAYGKIQRFIHVSTDEVYGSTRGTMMDEDQALMPTNTYSASKAAAEMYVRAYQKSFGLPAVIVRSNNVYGPQQYPQST